MRNRWKRFTDGLMHANSSRQLFFDALPQPPPPTFASDTSHEFLDLGVPLTGFKLRRHRIFILQRQGHMPAATHKM